MNSPDSRDFDDAWDVTPEEEARFFGSGRFSGMGCLFGILLITAIVAGLVVAAIYLLNDVKHWADSID